MPAADDSVLIHEVCEWQFIKAIWLLATYVRILYGNLLLETDVRGHLKKILSCAGCQNSGVVTNPILIKVCNDKLAM